MNDNPSVLLVDDSENDLLLVRRAFRKAEFNIPLQEAQNGVAAIAYLAGQGPYGDREQFPLPAVMLLDLNMPLKNGFEVLKWVRAQPGLKRLIVIVLTASMRDEDAERAYDHGANWFAVKPSEMENLIAMIRALRDWMRCTQFPNLESGA